MSGQERRPIEVGSSQSGGDLERGPWGLSRPGVGVHASGSDRNKGKCQDGAYQVSLIQYGGIQLKTIQYGGTKLKTIQYGGTRLKTIQYGGTQLKLF